MQLCTEILIFENLFEMTLDSKTKEIFHKSLVKEKRSLSPRELILGREKSCGMAEACLFKVSNFNLWLRKVEDDKMI